MIANTEPQKYARSLHAPISLGTTSDDRFMPRGYLAHFATLPQLVLTEKLDGQNNCFAAHGLYARSHAAPPNIRGTNRCCNAGSTSKTTWVTSNFSAKTCTVSTPSPIRS